MQGRSRTPRTGSRLRRGLLALSAVGLLLALPSSAAATTITVNTTVDELGSGPRCSLREALWSSNNNSNAQAQGCLAGAGTTRSGSRPETSGSTARSPGPAPTAEDAGIYGDLDITEPVNVVHFGLRGDGRHQQHRRRACLPRPRGHSPVRLAGLTIDGGFNFAPVGGAVLNDGILTIDSSTIVNGSADSGGGFANISGSALLRNSTVYGNTADAGRRRDLRQRRDRQPAQRDGLQQPHQLRRWGGHVRLLLRSGEQNAARRHSGRRQLRQRHRGQRLRQDRRCDHLAGPEPDRQHERLRISDAAAATSSTAAPGSSGSATSAGRPRPSTCARRARRSTPPAAARRPTSAAYRGGSGGRCDIGAWELTRCRGVVINNVGTNGAELLIGGSRADGFLALGGADTVRALGGNDGACGGGGPDRLEGGGGNDRLDGEGGRDTCIGGGGRDLLFSCEVRRASRLW